MKLFHKERKTKLRIWALDAFEKASSMVDENDPNLLVVAFDASLLHSISSFFLEAPQNYRPPHGPDRAGKRGGKTP